MKRFQKSRQRRRSTEPIAEAANRSYRVRVLNVEGREIVPWSAAAVQAGSLKLPAAALDAPASAIIAGGPGTTPHRNTGDHRH